MLTVTTFQSCLRTATKNSMIKTKKCETVKQKGTIIYTEVLSLAIDVEAAVKKIA